MKKKKEKPGLGTSYKVPKTGKDRLEPPRRFPKPGKPNTLTGRPSSTLARDLLWYRSTFWRRMRHIGFSLYLWLLNAYGADWRTSSTPVLAQQCGGSFGQWPWPFTMTVDCGLTKKFIQNLKIRKNKNHCSRVRKSSWNFKSPCIQKMFTNLGKN